MRAQDVGAWQEGFEAGGLLRPLSSCPYLESSSKGLSWSSGYIEGKASRRVVAELNEFTVTPEDDDE